MNMQSIMAQAQKMQRDINSKKDKINKMEFTGSSELVNVTVDGTKKIINIDINKEVSLEKDDIEVLEDMIKISLNDAFSKVDKQIEKDLGSYANAMGGLL